MTEPDKAAYDDLPDGVLVADGDGRVVVLNPAAARLLATSSDSALGRDYREVVPLVDEQGRDWWSCTDPYGGLPTRSRQPERVLTLPSGTDLLVTASYVRGTDRRVQRLVVCLRDTGARERIERSRANLVSTVAHELLDVSRIDAGRLEMRKQVVDLPAAVRKIVAGRVAAGEPESRFVVVETGPLPEMWVDPDKFQQVVGNLVENALRHGEGTVTITVGPDGDGAAVSVADEGEGIPEAVASRVFTRFWRGGDRRGGTGLGLYIVKGLVEAHGGSVSVGRAAGGGAEFRFVLPAGTPSFL